MTGLASGGSCRSRFTTLAWVSLSALVALVMLIGASNTAFAETKRSKARTQSSDTSSGTQAPAKSEPNGDSSTSGSSPTSPGASTIDQFKVVNTDGEGVRLRKEAGLSAEILAKLPEGALVTLSQGAAREVDGERWLPIKSDLANGWVAARYLTRVSSATNTLATTASRVLAADAPFTDRVSNIALKMVGQPYVWSGAGPGGFDCSGFVQWVYAQAGIKTMPRLIEEQMTLGAKVDGPILPGDMVIFVNTYRSGISHTGIYLGNNLFVHAADEAQGVTVSNMKDDYWGPRFLRAVRVRP